MQYQDISRAARRNASISNASYRAVNAVCGALVLVLAVVPAWGGNGLASDEDLPGLSYDLSGIVVDELERPMQSVEMTVVEVRPIPGSSELETRRTRSVIDGAFNVVCDDCGDLTLWFKAPGYRSERLRLGTTEEEEREAAELMEAVLNGEKVVQIPVLRRSGLVVRLTVPERRVRPVYLTGFLDIGKSGPGMVIGEDSKGLGMVVLSPEQAKQVEAGTAGGLSVARLEPAGGDLGDLLDRLVAKGAVGTSASEGGSLVLRFDSKAAGAVRVERTSGLEAGGMAFFRAMGEAPAEGYTDSLELELGDQDEVFFYCMIGGMYGKGWLTPVVLRPSSSDPRLMTNVEIYLDPTGSRDLRGLVP